ncbi:MAG: YceI family protein [Flavobacteriales bacterium]|jgi:uncharacterized protein YhdP|nr:YceI family protein [Flavobacteriales bacterium]
MLLKRIVLFAVLIFGIVACSSDSQKNKEEVKKEKKVETLNFSKEEVSVKWTAYKFTERVGVSGTFKDVKTDSKLYGATFKDALENARFDINISSVFSNSADRDKKLVQHFFGKMAKTSVIKGFVSEVKGTDKNGQLSLSIQMNDVSRTLAMEYRLMTNNAYSVKGIMNLSDWKADDAVTALNNVCKDLHKGADGVTKLWPDVKIEVVLPFKK